MRSTPKNHLDLGSARRHAGRGFTIIEILVVVVIIGIIAMFIIPNFLDSLSKAKQKRTMADIHDMGKSMMSWITDQIAAAAAGASAGSVNLNKYGDTLDADELSNLLVPIYIAHIPAKDAWGHQYDYHIKTEDLLGAQVMLIRSPGSDGVFAGETYDINPFVSTAYSEDIVWADGIFIRWPVGLDTFGAAP